MSDDLLTKPGALSVDKVCQAVSFVLFTYPAMVEAPASNCAFPRLCGKAFCRFPRYFQDDQPFGVVAKALIRLGYPAKLLKDLDCEHEMGEVLHPGVKINNSRNQALARIDPKGMALLTWVQEQSRDKPLYHQLHLRAMTPRKGLKFTDRRRRPWLY